jgi:hypothetical protein
MYEKMTRELLTEQLQKIFDYNSVRDENHKSLTVVEDYPDPSKRAELWMTVAPNGDVIVINKYFKIYNTYASIRDLCDEYDEFELFGNWVIEVL